VALTSIQLVGLGLGGAVLAYLGRRLWGRPMMPPLSLEFTARMHGPLRSVAPGRIRLLVVHVTDPPTPLSSVPTARSTAGYFAETTLDASTHVVVDDKEGYRTLADTVVPYGASGGDANTRGLHIEFAGHSGWTRAQWLQHPQMLARGGAVLAAWAAQYDLPLVFLGPQAVGDGLAEGVTTHAAVTQGFRVPGGHMDPGAGFPMDVLLRYARGG
jgi:hypothetical protein